MAAKMKATNYPGIYRRGSRWVIRYRADGKHRSEAFRTLDEAKRAMSDRHRQTKAGSYREPDRRTVRQYGRAWVEAYPRVSDRTRREYRRDLEQHVYPEIGARKMTAVGRRDVGDLVRTLQGQDLAPQTVRRIIAPLAAMFRTFMNEDGRTDNPALRLDLKTPRKIRKRGASRVKPFTREQLSVILDVVDPQWRPLFMLLAGSGLRISEALALEVGDLHVDGLSPYVEVRQARVLDENGRPALGVPKSAHGEREIPLAADVVDAIRPRLEGRAADDLAFPSRAGTMMSPENLDRRVLKPAVQEAGVTGLGFHGFRHAFAAMHIKRGTNIVQLSRLLGHHSPSFTLERYGGLMDDGTGAPLDLAAELQGEHKVGTDPTALDATVPDVLPADFA